MSNVSISILLSYSHKDKALQARVAEHLSALKRSNVIQDWHDHMLPSGSERNDEINCNLDTANIILLLVSASFLNSDFCWSQELRRAIDRHEAGETCVIPVILRSCTWQKAPFGKLEMLPKNGKAVTSWNNEDEALTDVAEDIWLAVEQIPRKELRSEKGLDYAPLRDLLKAGLWQAADEETYRLMCVVMEKQHEGWLSEEDCRNFPCTDLRTIDRLWMKYSDGRFGFSAQKQIYVETKNPLDGMYHPEAFARFGERVGWRMKRQSLKQSSSKQKSKKRDEHGIYEEWIYHPGNFDTFPPDGHLPSLFMQSSVEEPSSVKELDRKLRQILKDKDDAVRSQNFDKAGELRDQEMKLKTEIKGIAPLRPYGHLPLWSLLSRGDL